MSESKKLFTEREEDHILAVCAMSTLIAASFGQMIDNEEYAPHLGGSRREASERAYSPAQSVHTVPGEDSH